MIESMEKIMMVLKTLFGILPNGWAFLGYIVWRGISGLFKYLSTLAVEKTRRLEINTLKDIELTKEENRHKEFKILNGTRYRKT
jgi:hypothetical protein